MVSQYPALDFPHIGTASFGFEAVLARFRPQPRSARIRIACFRTRQEQKQNHRALMCSVFRPHHLHLSMEDSALHLDAARTRMVTLHCYSDEFDTFYEPLYLHNRGFHDFRTASTNRALTLVEHNIPADVLDWDVSDRGLWQFKFGSVWLRLQLCSNTKDFLTTEVISVSTSLSITTVDSLRQELQKIIRESIESTETFFDLVILILQLVEVTSYFCSVFINQTSFVGVFKWSNDDVKTAQMMKWNRAGLNPLSVTDTCYEYLGLTPLDICKMIPECYRILEMKSVRSQELTDKFLTFREKFIHKCKHATTDELRRKMHPRHGLHRRNLATVGRDEIIKEMMRPHATFHGTAQALVSSIAKHGFHRPGDEVEGLTIASPRSGAIFRRGIYSSQEAWFAMSFAQCHSDQPVPLDELPGMRLFVCATVVGRTLIPNRKDGPATYYETWEKVHGPRVKGFDSHFDGTYEYVVHDTHAILPCYVISLDFGPEACREVHQVQQLYGTYDGPTAGEPLKSRRSEALSLHEQREKEKEDKSIASKLLPFGFGAAHGASFRVKDLIDRDESQESQDAKAYYELKKQFEYTSGQTFDFWVGLLAGRGPRFSNEPEFAVPMNLEKLLHLGE